MPRTLSSKASSACCRQAAGNYRLAACAPQKSTSDITQLNPKRFPCHFQAQSFDALKLILRPLFELGAIRALERRKILRNRPQGAPEKPLAGTSQSQCLQRLKQAGAVIYVPNFYPNKFLGHPRAGFTDSAFLGTEFPNHIAQRFLIGLNVTAPVAKDLSEPILRMVLDHLLE